MWTFLKYSLRNLKYFWVDEEKHFIINIADGEVF